MSLLTKFSFLYVRSLANLSLTIGLGLRRKGEGEKEKGQLAERKKGKAKRNCSTTFLLNITFYFS